LLGIVITLFYTTELFGSPKFQLFHNQTSDEMSIAVYREIDSASGCRKDRDYLEPEDASASGTFDQSTGRIRILKLLGIPNDLVKRITQSTLLVDEALRVIHDVHEQKVRDLQLDLFLYSSRHCKHIVGAGRLRLHINVSKRRLAMPMPERSSDFHPHAERKFSVARRVSRHYYCRFGSHAGRCRVDNDGGYV
jgi:hypothetical protein